MNIWTDPVDHADWLTMQELRKSLKHMKAHRFDESLQEIGVNYDLSIKYENGLMKRFFNKVTVN